MTQHIPPYVDMQKLTEDERIHVVGHTLTCKKCAKRLQEKGRVALLVDNEPEKVERYIKKLTDKFPSVYVANRFDGQPIPTVTTLILKAK